MNIIHPSTNKPIGLTHLGSSQTYLSRKHCRQFKMQKKEKWSVETILNVVYSNYRKYSDSQEIDTY
jgi:hypothetical protein